jgi:hypothetical protein
MHRQKLETTIAEAQRFLASVTTLKQRDKEREQARKEFNEANGLAFLANMSYFEGCKESGAVRRASMDLTRALAALRKP